MVHPYVLHNDEIRRAEEPAIAPGQVGALSGWGVFSTMRVARGMLFEFPRHFARMQPRCGVNERPFPHRFGPARAIASAPGGGERPPRMHLASGRDAQ